MNGASKPLQTFFFLLASSSTLNSTRINGHVFVDTFRSLAPSFSFFSHPHPADLMCPVDCSQCFLSLSISRAVHFLFTDALDDLSRAASSLSLR